MNINNNSTFINFAEVLKAKNTDEKVYSTMAVGEEGGNSDVSDKALINQENEVDAFVSQTKKDETEISADTDKLNKLTSEEVYTTMAVGEEGGSAATTMAVGEGGGASDKVDANPFIQVEKEVGKSTLKVDDITTKETNAADKSTSTLSATGVESTSVAANEKKTDTTTANKSTNTASSTTTKKESIIVKIVKAVVKAVKTTTTKIKNALSRK